MNAFPSFFNSSSAEVVAIPTLTKFHHWPKWHIYTLVSIPFSLRKRAAFLQSVSASSVLLIEGSDNIVSQ